MNANGQFDVNETGLAGAVVALSSGLAQTTGSDGIFVLYNPSNEIIYINASFYINGMSGYEIEGNRTLDENYISTNAIPGYPNVSKVDSRTLMVHAGYNETYVGNMFGIVHAVDNVAVVSGYVFYDEDENGVFNGGNGDFGIPEMNVTLELPVDNETTHEIWTITDLNGSYQFAVYPGTDMRITSTRPEGHYHTTIESVVVRPPSSGVYSDNNFGYSNDTGVWVIYGIVYEDINGDGEQDDGELGLKDAIVVLEYNGTTLYNVTTTGNGLLNGTFSFNVSKTGVYGVYETNPLEYRSTTPDAIRLNVLITQSSYYVDFGDAQKGFGEFATIYGTVFEDVDGDGVWDAGESGIPGVKVTLDGTLTNTTDVYGSYALTTNVTGVHTVIETDPASVFSTTPNTMNLDVTKGNSYEANFGDAYFGVNVSGYVYVDVNKNGTQEVGETGVDLLPVVMLWNEQLFDYRFPNSSGFYKFTSLPPGNLTVMSAAAFYPSFVENTTISSVDIAAVFGEEYRVDFGLYVPSMVGGWVLLDLGGEGGPFQLMFPLSGVEITLLNKTEVVNTTTTNEYGMYMFEVAPGNYTVVETDPDVSGLSAHHPTRLMSRWNPWIMRLLSSTTP